MISVEQKRKIEMHPTGGNNPCEEKSKIEMHLTGGNNPCGTKEEGRDASGRSK